MSFDPHAYTIVIRKVVANGAAVFHGRVIELPDLEAFEPSYEEAYRFLIDTIQTSKSAFDEQGRPFPDPLPPNEESHSGRVTLRMPRWLHARLDFLAQADGTSLNQYMIALLARGAAHIPFPQQATAPASARSLWGEAVQAATSLYESIPGHVFLVHGSSVSSQWPVSHRQNIVEMTSNLPTVQMSSSVQRTRQQLTRVTITSDRLDFGTWHSGGLTKEPKTGKPEKKAHR
jgi:predicted HicB family RNase H-like nuclease